MCASIDDAFDVPQVSNRGKEERELLWRIEGELKQIEAIISNKENGYLNYASKSDGIFSGADSIQRLLVRIDDRLNQIKSDPNTYGPIALRDLVCSMILLLSLRR